MFDEHVGVEFERHVVLILVVCLGTLLEIHHKIMSSTFDPFQTHLLVVLVHIFDRVDGAVADVRVVDGRRAAVAGGRYHGNVVVGAAGVLILRLTVVRNVEVVVLDLIQILVRVVGLNGLTNIIIRYLFV